MLHTVYLPLAWQARGPSTVRLEGGTHNDHAPCYHFNEVTWRCYLERMGLRVSMRMERPGFYPRGGGKVEVRIEPCHRIAPLTLTAGAELTTLSGFSADAGLPLALSEGESRYRVSAITAHLTTNLTMIGQFLRRRLECVVAEGEPGELHIGPTD